jgi:UDP-N-acetyl-D-galactosamine dehydrogenase
MNDLKIAVIGLGYVGLPLALAFAKKFKNTVGFDVNERKVKNLLGGIDVTNEGLEDDIKSTSLLMTSNPKDLENSNLFIVGVPTPIDSYNRPDLSCLESACKILGPVISKGSIVVFESTVYPGVTEDFCGRILSEISGLKCGTDFKLGYSPERINPGDKEHSLQNVTKVVSGCDADTLETVAKVYSEVVTAGVYRAQSIKVAEAAKVIENTQRDLNIALINELAIIFKLLNLNTKDVLAAAGTKWNFLPFQPGLVGGHCIGVDPYYLTSMAEKLGYRPQVILAGRRINDGMGKYVGQEVVKTMVKNGITCKEAKVGVLGLTFKENVTDIRNSRVPDIIRELNEFGINPLIHDPHASSEEVHEEYGLEISDIKEFKNLDALFLAVAHNEFKQMGIETLTKMLKETAVFADIKGLFKPEQVKSPHIYWSL